MRNLAFWFSALIVTLGTTASKAFAVDVSAETELTHEVDYTLDTNFWTNDVRVGYFTYSYDSDNKPIITSTNLLTPDDDGSDTFTATGEIGYFISYPNSSSDYFYPVGNANESFFNPNGTEWVEVSSILLENDDTEAMNVFNTSKGIFTLHTVSTLVPTGSPEASSTVTFGILLSVLLARVFRRQPAFLRRPLKCCRLETQNA